EAVLPDLHVTRDHYMRADEAVIADDRVMAHMVSAPERHVIADGDEWLDGVVLEDEAIVARSSSCQERAAAADVADELVPERLRFRVLRSPHTIHLPIADRDEHLMA